MNELKKKTGKPAEKKAAKPAVRAEKPLKKVSMAKPGTMLFPLPAVMVSCGKAGEDANIITVAWTGTVNTEPPMVYISVRKSRHSHGLLMRDREFVINLPSQDQVKALDWCGVRSGRMVDKFKEMNLTAAPAEKVGCPIIKECPVHLECKVVSITELPSHDMFLAEVVNVQVNEDMLDSKGALHLEKAKLIAYNHGKYYPVPRVSMMRFGESVMKDSTKKRLDAERKGKRRAARRRG